MRNVVTVEAVHTHTHTHTCNLKNNKKSMKYALLKIYARDG